MNLIQSWLSANKLTLNVKNTKDMFIGSQFKLSQMREGPLENLMGGRGRSTKKKYSRKGKLNEKKLCTSINAKKYSCYGLKKIHARNLITKKIPAARKFPPPPPSHNFSNGPPLNSDLTVKVNNTPLERVIKHKSLGVQIDESLNSLAPTH